jgi:hypothetical protein
MSLFGKKDAAVAPTSALFKDAAYDQNLMAFKVTCPVCSTNHMIADVLANQAVSLCINCAGCYNEWKPNSGWRYDATTYRTLYGNTGHYSTSGYYQQQMAQASGWPSPGIPTGYAQALAYSQNLSSLPYSTPYPGARAITTTMPDGLKDYPERADVLIGYRAYQLKWDGKDICLKGARVDWAEREFTAKCTALESARLEDDPSPEELCRIHLADPNATCTDDHHGCGIYAMRKAQGIDYVNLESYRIVAETALFGWVATYTLGYRAEKARIEKLTYLHDGVVLAPDQAIADALMARYGVPVEFQAITAWKAA